MAGYKVKDRFDRRFYKNPYAGSKESRIQASRENLNSPQYPKRMRVAGKNAVSGPVVDYTKMSDKQLLAVMEGKSPFNTMKDVPIEDNPYTGVELVHRHRYGDDIDILRATFTKSVAELEEEKFKLINECEALIKTTFIHLLKVPKHEKYVLGGDIRKRVYQIFSHSVAIKKRFSRKNMLEFIDVELETLRHLFKLASSLYPNWITHEVLDDEFRALNNVGRIVGGLLKTTVA